MFHLFLTGLLLLQSRQRKVYLSEDVHEFVRERVPYFDGDILKHLSSFILLNFILSRRLKKVVPTQCQHLMKPQVVVCTLQFIMKTSEMSGPECLYLSTPAG